MEEYHCKWCKYHTKKLSTFKDHLNSNKHITNIEGITIENDKLLEKVKIFCCDNCDKIYTSNQALKNHKIKCLDMTEAKFETMRMEIKELKKSLKQRDAQLEKKEAQIDKSLDIAKSNSQTANTSMNMLKYAKLYLNDAEPLEEIKGSDIFDAIKYKNPKKNESKNEEYVKTAIYKFEHGIFANFIGDMIIEYYKPKTKTDANVIATDTSRLCFIIMQKITKRGKKTEQKEWINDKSGKRFTELVLRPLIGAVRETLVEFYEFKKNKGLDGSNESNINTLNRMTKCSELRRDIDADKFINPILKYVAPSFHFDKIKLLDNNNKDVESESDSDSESMTDTSDEIPVKIRAKKRK